MSDKPASHASTCIFSPMCWRACMRSAPRSRPRATGPPASISPASWSSRRATPAHGDMATNAAMVLAKDAEGQAARSRRTDRGKTARGRSGGIRRGRRSRLHQSHLEAAGLGGRAAHRAARGRGLRQERDRRRRKGQCRICLGQSDRADACRPLPRRGVRRRAVQPAALRRLRRHRANITSTTPARRSTCSRARRSCATARRSARTSARFRKGSIPATIS